MIIQQSDVVSQSSVIEVLAWTVLIVLSELLAFYLIQKSVDEQSGFNIKVIFSALLFGVIVTYAFRQILNGGTNIPIANLYWIIFSQIGSIIVAYYFFNQSINLKDWIAIILLFISLLITIYG
jgi:hypothetical protein